MQDSICNILVADSSLSETVYLNRDRVQSKYQGCVMSIPSSRPLASTIIRITLKF